MNDVSRADLWARVSEHRERLLKLARSRTPTAEDAEDCVHEAMLRCVEFENLDPERLGALLTTVTIRVCADRYRSRQYADRLHHRLSAHPVVAAGHEDDVCDRAEAEWLAAKVHELPARQQELVRARAEGLSFSEVAAQFRMSYTAVESQFARARTAIRSARISALGVLGSPRWRLVTLGGVSVGAAVLATVAPSFHPDEVERRPREVVLPESRPVVAPEPERPVVTETAPRAVTVRPAPASARRLSAPLPAPPPKRDPKERQENWVDAPIVPIGPDTGHYEYTTTERVQHCIEYGIEISEQRVQCNYPPS